MSVNTSSLRRILTYALILSNFILSSCVLISKEDCKDCCTLISNENCDGNNELCPEIKCDDCSLDYKDICYDACAPSDNKIGSKINNTTDEEIVKLNIGESKEIKIYACKSWNESGIYACKGQEYLFEIKEIKCWQDSTIKSHPVCGWQDSTWKKIGFFIGFMKRSDKAPWYALVGTVSRCDEDTFAVPGDETLVTMNKSGMLYFYANDKIGRYFNNLGSLSLTITRRK